MTSTTPLALVTPLNSCTARTVMDEFRRGIPRMILSTIATQYKTARDGSGRFTAKDLANGRRATVNPDFSLNSNENHLAACIKLLQRVYEGNPFQLVSYEQHCSGNGYVFVFAMI